MAIFRCKYRGTQQIIPASDRQIANEVLLAYNFFGERKYPSYLTGHLDILPTIN